MDQKNHKNTDCYFFYYSTCTKGDSCAYRHEPSALGSETVCQFWQQGSCHNQHCNFRHMEIKKNRKVIPCYWEKFPAGCKKPHCPFLHKQTRSNISNPIEAGKPGATPIKPGSQEWANRPDGKFDGNSGETEQPVRGGVNSEASSFIGSPAVDPLIVNFEEESDNESVSSKIVPSPSKFLSKNNKTYEQIRLEEIAREADFYSYNVYQNSLGGGKMIQASQASQKQDKLNFNILSLEEIRQRKRLKQEEKTTEDQLLRDTLRTLDHLRDLHPREQTSDSKAKRKMSFSEVEESKSPKVPPIRLKRTRRVSPERSRQNEVEVRVCDSSTDNFVHQSVVEPMDEDDDDEDIVSQTCAKNLELESTDDDILKDIDALLTDDTSS